MKEELLEKGSLSEFKEKITLRELIKEIGVLIKRELIENYISRLIVGRCSISIQGENKIFLFPEEKEKLQRYLKEIDPREEILIDLSPVAICLLISEDYMYSLQKTY